MCELRSLHFEHHLLAQLVLGGVENVYFVLDTLNLQRKLSLVNSCQPFFISLHSLPPNSEGLVLFSVPEGVVDKQCLCPDLLVCLNILLERVP